MKTAYTLGPWKITTHGNKTWGNTLGQLTYITGPIKGEVAICSIIVSAGKPQTAEANARLIVAAPELLEACKRIDNAPYGVALGDLRFLRNAITLAERGDEGGR